MLGIRIRIGAAYDELRTPDGQVIDRSTLARPARNKLTRMVREIYALHLSRKSA